MVIKTLLRFLHGSSPMLSRRSRINRINKEVPLTEAQREILDLKLKRLTKNYPFTLFTNGSCYSSLADYQKPCRYGFYLVAAKNQKILCGGGGAFLDVSPTAAELVAVQLIADFKPLYDPKRRLLLRTISSDFSPPRASATSHVKIALQRPKWFLVVYLDRTFVEGADILCQFARKLAPNVSFQFEDFTFQCLGDTEKVEQFRVATRVFKIKFFPEVSTADDDDDDDFDEDLPAIAADDDEGGVLEKACFSSSSVDSPCEERGKNRMIKRITPDFHLVKGKSNHAMEDCLVSEIKQIDNNVLGLFAIFDGHVGHDVANYLQSNLFNNILKENDFWTDPTSALRRAYSGTDKDILERSVSLGKGGSTAVTAILINGQKLVVANVGDSRAVICKNGVAKQLSVDHEPNKEKKTIESKGGFVSNLPGDVPRVNGQLAVARAFGDKSLKRHLSSEPDIVVEIIDDDVEFAILASDGLWKVMSNQEAVNSVKNMKDPQSAAKQLTDEALSRKSRDDISCIVVRFQ